jgi:hypothetical protein
MNDHADFGWMLLILGLVIAGVGLVWILAPSTPQWAICRRPKARKASHFVPFRLTTSSTIHPPPAKYWSEAGSATDSFQYNYDRDGNRLTRNNLLRTILHVFSSGPLQKSSTLTERFSAPRC